MSNDRTPLKPQRTKFYCFKHLCRKQLGPASTVIFKINASLAMYENISTHKVLNEMSTLSIVLNNANFSNLKSCCQVFQLCWDIQIFSLHKCSAFDRDALKITNTGELFQEEDFYKNKTERIN